MWIRRNFSVSALLDEKSIITPSSDTSVFLIVNRVSEKGYIRKESELFITSGCRDYHFIGKMEPVWHMAVDDADILLNDDSDNIAMTSGYKDVDDFADSLFLAITTQPSHICYLLYDDFELMNRVFQQLQRIWDEEGMEKLNDLPVTHYWQETYCTDCRTGFTCDILDSWTYHIDQDEHEYFEIQCPKCGKAYYVRQGADPKSAIPIESIDRNLVSVEVYKLR